MPYVRDAKTWCDTAATRLYEELDRQVYPDGAQIELTPGYHNVSLRNFLAPVKSAKHYDYVLPEGYVAKLERMYAYNMWAMRPDRDLPRWNDSWHVDVKRHCKEGASLFPHRKDFLWIATDGNEGEPPDHLSHIFPYAGQVVLRSSWDRDAIFLGFEIGPFGYGHQHEDKLGIVLFAYGKPLLVEGGSYAYDASRWRAYVLSSRAHNVILVDGKGQKRRGRPRIEYVARAAMKADFHSDAFYDHITGIYDEGFGPKREKLARHKREVIFQKRLKLFIIRDTLSSLDGKPHTYEALFHVDTKKDDFPNVNIVPEGPPGDLEIQVITGQEKPVVQGWMPLGHGVRGVRPIPTIIHKRHGKHVRFMTVLQPLRDGKEKRVTKVCRSQNGATLTFEDGRTEEVWLIGTRHHTFGTEAKDGRGDTE